MSVTMPNPNLHRSYCGGILKKTKLGNDVLRPGDRVIADSGVKPRDGSFVLLACGSGYVIREWPVSSGTVLGTITELRLVVR
jgi:hypothetical protein